MEGWHILNRAKTGERESSVGIYYPIKWSKKAIREKAKECGYVLAVFAEQYPGAYEAIQSRYKGLLNELFPNRVIHTHHTIEDALLVGSMLITLLRHADRVKIACLAQLVNVIAPIMTSDTGAWRQTIFYPYMHASVYGRGTVLNTVVKSPSYESKHGEAPFIDSVVTVDDENETLTIFAVNKNLKEDMELTCDLRQYAGYKVVEHIVLTNDDLKAVNTEKKPNTVAPVLSNNTKIEKGILDTVLPSKSWNVIRLAK